MASTARRLTTQGLSMLRGVGGWMAIQPEKTYVASSIRGLGQCRSTYVAPSRRELPERIAGRRLHASLLLASIAALAVLSACATQRAEHTAATCTADLADCQKDTAPVSPGAGGRAVVTSVVAWSATPAAAKTAPAPRAIEPAAAEAVHGDRAALD